jgi:hypothetical protein
MTFQSNQQPTEKPLTDQQLLEQLMRAWSKLDLKQKETITATANMFAEMVDLEKPKH